MWEIISGICCVLGLLITIIVNIVAMIRFSTKQEVALDSLGKAFSGFKDDIKNTISDFKQDVDNKIRDVKEDFKEHLGRVEKKQDKHNNVIERTFALEKVQSVQEEQIKVINHRVHDLEIKEDQ